MSELPDAESDAGVDVSEGFATCATISDSVAGTSTCRNEVERCSLTIPATSSCEAACGAMNLQCLRAYDESAPCLAAVEYEALDCATPPATTGFCQCGDRSATYDEWTVITIGDSTMSNGTTGESGWGDEFPTFGVRPDDVINEGSSGASSLDFETRSNWPRTQALLGPNVFLLIQFGHNDTSSDEDRHTEPGDAPEYMDSYRERLAFYVAAAREAGATPIIATSMGQMVFDADGVSSENFLTPYANAATRFAMDEGLMLHDGHRVSRAEYTRMGPEETIARYSLDDVNHFTPAGARRLAELMAHLGCIESEAYCAQFTIP